MTRTTDGKSDGKRALNAIFFALGHSTRRQILLELCDRNPREGVEVEPEVEGPIDRQSGQDYIELYHKHLPLLDEAGFITWDRNSGWITQGENFMDIRFVLELLDNHQEELPGDWP